MLTRLILLVFLICTTLMACNNSTEAVVPSPPPADEKSCQEAGGNWGQFGLIRTDDCNLPTSDAGRICSDGSQCESICFADANVSPNSAAEGQCYDWTIARGSCLNHVNEGVAQGMICID